jgi:hypothetical protein
MLQAGGVMKECHNGRANTLENRERFNQSPRGACFIIDL